MPVCLNITLFTRVHHVSHLHNFCKQRSLMNKSADTNEANLPWTLFITFSFAAKPVIFRITAPDLSLMKENFPQRQLALTELNHGRSLWPCSLRQRSEAV